MKSLQSVQTQQVIEVESQETQREMDRLKAMLAQKDRDIAMLKSRMESMNTGFPYDVVDDTMTLSGMDSNASLMNSEEFIE